MFLGKGAAIQTWAAQMILHDTAIISRQPPFPGKSENVDNSLHQFGILDTPNFGDHCDKSEERREESIFSLTMFRARTLRLAMMPSHVNTLYTLRRVLGKTHSVSIADGGAEPKSTNKLLSRWNSRRLQLCSASLSAPLLLSIRTIQPRIRQRHTSWGQDMGGSLGSVNIWFGHDSVTRQELLSAQQLLHIHKQLLPWE